MALLVSLQGKQSLAFIAIVDVWPISSCIMHVISLRSSSWWQSVRVCCMTNTHARDLTHGHGVELAVPPSSCTHALQYTDSNTQLTGFVWTSVVLLTNRLLLVLNISWDFNCGMIRWDKCPASGQWSGGGNHFMNNILGVWGKVSVSSSVTAHAPTFSFDMKLKLKIVSN